MSVYIIQGRNLNNFYGVGNITVYRKSSMTQGGAEYLSFDNILSTIVAYLCLYYLTLTGMIQIYTSSAIINICNSFDNCNFQPGDCFILVQLILVQKPWEPFLFLLISGRSGSKLETCFSFRGNYNNNSDQIRHQLKLRVFYSILFHPDLWLCCSSGPGELWLASDTAEIVS